MVTPFKLLVLGKILRRAQDDGVRRGIAMNILGRAKSDGLLKVVILNEQSEEKNLSCSLLFQYRTLLKKLLEP